MAKLSRIAKPAAPKPSASTKTWKNYMDKLAKWEKDNGEREKIENALNGISKRKTAPRTRPKRKTSATMGRVTKKRTPAKKTASRGTTKRKTTKRTTRRR